MNAVYSCSDRGFVDETLSGSCENCIDETDDNLEHIVPINEQSRNFIFTICRKVVLIGDNRRE